MSEKVLEVESVLPWLLDVYGGVAVAEVTVCLFA